LNETDSTDVSDYRAPDRVASEPETVGENDAHRLPAVVDNTASADSSFNLAKLDTTNDNADADAVLPFSSLNENDSTDAFGYIASNRDASEPETGDENDARILPAVVDNTALVDSSCNLWKLDATDDDADADAVLPASSLNATGSTDASGYIASNRDASEPETGDENDAHRLPAVVDNTASVDSSCNLSKLDTMDDGTDADADVVRHSSFSNETDFTGNGVAIQARTSGADYENGEKAALILCLKTRGTMVLHQWWTTSVKLHCEMIQTSFLSTHLMGRFHLSRLNVRLLW
jgi:hypothetical protein